MTSRSEHRGKRKGRQRASDPQITRDENRRQMSRASRERAKARLTVLKHNEKKKKTSRRSREHAHARGCSPPPRNREGSRSGEKKTKGIHGPSGSISSESVGRGGNEDFASEFLRSQPSAPRVAQWQEREREESTLNFFANPRARRHYDRRESFAPLAHPVTRFKARRRGNFSMMMGDCVGMWVCTAGQWTR